MPYIEGFVAAVPTSNKADYIAHARKSVAFFKKLGATRVVECWGEDIPKGALTDFYKATQAKEDRRRSSAGSSIPIAPRATPPTSACRTIPKWRAWLICPSTESACSGAASSKSSTSDKPGVHGRPARQTHARPTVTTVVTALHSERRAEC